MDDLSKQVLALVQRFPNPEDFVREIESENLPENLKVDRFLQFGIKLFDFSYFKLALVVWNKALGYYIQSKNRSGESYCYTNLGNTYLSLGDFRKAIEYYEKSLEIAKETGNRSGESGCYMGLGNAYQYLGDYQKAIMYHEQSLEIAKQTGDSSGESRCYVGLGNVCFRLGDYWKAMEYYEKSLEINRRIADRRGESRCYWGLGNAYFGLGDNRKAIEYYEKSLEIFKEMDSRLEESRCYVGIGIVHYRLGDFRKAIEYHEKSLEIVREIGDRLGESSCYAGLGNAYLSLGDYRKAIEYREKSLEIAKQIGDRVEEANCYTVIGLAYYYFGDYLKAIRFYEKSLEITKNIGDRSGESKCYSALGNAYCSLGDYSKAIECHELSLRIDKQISDRSGESGCYICLGHAYRNLGDFQKAIINYKKSIELCDKIGAMYDKKICLCNLGRAYLDQADFASAEQYLEHAVDILEVMRAENIPREYKSEFWKDNIYLFDNLVTTESKLDKHQEALEYSERGKGRTISDLILTRGIEEKAFRPKPLAFREIEGLSKKIQKNLVLLRVTPKGTYVFILTPGAGLNCLEITDFDTKILDDLLLRFDGDKPIDGWIYRYSNYKTAQHEAKQLLTQRKPHDALNLLKAEESNWFKSMDDTLKRLYDELLVKVFSRFKTGEKVVIIPNRSLNILPLHACFYEENGNRRYLLEDYEITYAPNCNLLDLCYRREEENRARDSLFAIANPTPPFDLVFSEWEIDEISRLFQDKEVHIREEVKDGLLTKSPHHGIIHLSTHGIYDLGSSFNSRLLLGKDTDLTLTEIFEKVRLDKSWLVTLSACESGLTDYRDIADESIGLQTGFLYAGAPTVIASLWSVNDFTTALVMVKTYENIFRKGLSKAESLRSAQLWLKDLTAGEALELLEKKQMELESSTRMAGEDISPLRRLISLEDPQSRPFSHPYYWAGFQVFGA